MAKACIELIIVNVIWGLSFLASARALSAGLAPMTLTLVRTLTAALILMPALFLKKDEGRKLAKKDFGLMLLTSLFGYTAYYFFEYNGLTRTSTSSASLIVASVPVITLIVNCVLMKRRPRAATGLGTLFSLAGVALVVGMDTGTLDGDLLMLGATVTWVAYIFISKRLRIKYSSLAMNGWQAALATVTLIPFAAAEKVDLSAVPADGWLCALALGVICSALCYFVYGSALSKVSETVSSVFINLIPVSTLLANAALGESVSLAQWLGGALIVGGVVLVTFSEASRKA